jgi:hypothetical protein
MSEMPSLSEEFSAGPARIRFDVLGRPPAEGVLADSNFLNYRLADVRVEPATNLTRADIVWRTEGEKSIAYRDGVMSLVGQWDEGPMQKLVVALLALRLEAAGWHPFHASAVRYRDRSILYLGGESNHGKSMGQIESCRCGGQLISTETTVIDEDGVIRMGSKDVYLKKRAKGTERADKAAPNRAVEKFFGEMPSWQEYTAPSEVDVVIVPAIDGNFDPSTVEMIPFERQFQTLHSLQNYFLLNELLAPGWPMPIIDTEELRRARAGFVARFCERPYYFVRAANPRVLMDEVERVI